MTKITGPYCEFVIRKDGAKTYFDFTKGNLSLNIFDQVKNGLKGAFNIHFGGAYIEDRVLEDGTKSISIDQRMVLTAIKAILGGGLKDFKVLIKGIEKDGTEGEEFIGSYSEVKFAARVVPFYNQNNNDMTTRRAK